jgi:hypothetical protein
VQVLQELETLGLVAMCRREEHHVACYFTPAGLGKLVRGVTVAAPYHPVLRPNHDQPVQDQSVYELLLWLQKKGWQHVQLGLGQRLASAGVPLCFSGGDRIWVTRANALSVSREYLVLLAAYDEHKRPVPHLQSHATYVELLSGQPNPATSRFHFLPDDGTARVQTKPHRAHPAPPLQDMHGDAARALAPALQDMHGDAARALAPASALAAERGAPEAVAVDDSAPDLPPPGAASAPGAEARMGSLPHVAKGQVYL